MVEYIVSASESGQHVIRFCKHLYPKAQNGFLHKMLRKKNITVNGKKADGAKVLSEGDQVRFYLSDEVLSSISKETSISMVADISSHIIYEDDHLILFNKPAGMLSQKAKPSDISANEHLLSYLERGDKKVPVMGLPGCVMYAGRTIFDLMLPRIAAKDPVTADEIAALGEGGLCLNCKICTWPNCGFGKGC